MKKVTTYRDRATGRFVSAAKWKRSKARGGTKFVRSSYERKKKERKIVSEPLGYLDFVGVESTYAET